ncbi:zinc-finger domain-containing protein [Mesobacillus foraminis]|uniref:zinc-finger domain-containing protein n=1 Tax=Mesobacillus foraminis TaxID=279826 RepID=UPI001BE84753|nr:zinc-finger domain-containing protein [Mesobacillus foraminis]MBT2754982.1 zinc-finger domain-containing protein [Mesobacillus foraminis]
MTRKELLLEVEDLLNTYCEGCFLKSQHRKDNGKRYAHKFCISACTVGEKIKRCGDKLSEGIFK